MSNNNRIIKFRVWNKYQKFFLEPDSFAVMGNGSLLFFDYHNGQDLSWNRDCWNIQGELYAVQQFTGLLDKNSKEIFEGDIVKLYVGNGKYHNYTIRFKDGCFMVGGDILVHHNRECEVIGNIYENPNC